MAWLGLPVWCQREHFDEPPSSSGRRERPAGFSARYVHNRPLLFLFSSSLPLLGIAAASASEPVTSETNGFRYSVLAQVYRG